MALGTANGKYFDEIPEDSRFLLEIPDDSDYESAIRDLKENVEAVRERAARKNGCQDGRCLAGELVPIVRAVLGLEYYGRITSATAVIFNVILETREACGDDSSEIIIQRLRERRAKIAAALAAASTKSMQDGAVCTVPASSTE